MTTSSGGDLAGLNFGEFVPVTLGGEVYNDSNGDGALESGEPGLSGWTVDLVNAANQTVSTTTGSGGSYSFSGVGPGSYTIEAVAQSGFVASPATSLNLTTSSGANLGDLNLGEFQTVNLGGEIYNDINGDAALESGESGLSGWTVDLVNSANQTVSTTTGSGGSYSFTGVGPGSYQVEAVSRSGYVLTSA